MSRPSSEILGAVAAFLAAILLSLPAIAQGASPGAGLASPIVVVDQERLFDDSLFGQRVLDRIDRQSQELAAENREIETRLVAEERALTEQRRTMTREAFREVADAFDARVSQLRSEQDEKVRAVNRMRDEAQQEFFGRVTVILRDILVERGALVLMDRRAVLSAVDAVDITNEAIERIDAAIGADPSDEGSQTDSTPDE